MALDRVHPGPTLETLFDPAHRADPYPSFEAWSRGAAVTELADGTWFVTRYADAEAVLRDPRFGHAEPGTLRSDGAKVPDRRSFLRMNPPDHSRLRRLVSHAFTARTVAALEPRIAELAEDLVREVVAAPGEVDLIAALAAPLPIAVICELLGVPYADRERFTLWSAAVARGLDPEFLLSEDERVRLETARTELGGYFAELAEVKRRDPQDDLLSALVGVRDEGDRLSEVELLTTCNLLLIAGHETTVNLIGNGILALLRHPDQQDRLRAEPDLGAGAVEEFLRYDPPVQLSSRTALEDVPVAGTTVPAGDTVLVGIAAANRDARVFDEPGRLDVTRTDVRHLTFGHGIHFCLGAPLARLEGRIAIGTLLAAARHLELAREPEWKDNLILRGQTALWVSAR